MSTVPTSLYCGSGLVSAHAGSGSGHPCGKHGPNRSARIRYRTTYEYTAAPSRQEGCHGKLFPFGLPPGPFSVPVHDPAQIGPARAAAGARWHNRLDQNPSAVDQITRVTRGGPSTRSANDFGPGHPWLGSALQADSIAKPWFYSTLWPYGIRLSGGEGASGLRGPQ